MSIEKTNAVKEVQNAIDSDKPSFDYYKHNSRHAHSGGLFTSDSSQPLAKLQEGFRSIMPKVFSRSTDSEDPLISNSTDTMYKQRRRPSALTLTSTTESIDKVTSSPSTPSLDIPGEGRRGSIASKQIGQEDTSTINQSTNAPSQITEEIASQSEAFTQQTIVGNYQTPNQLALSFEKLIEYLNQPCKPKDKAMSSTTGPEPRKQEWHHDPSQTPSDTHLRLEKQSSQNDSGFISATVTTTVTSEISLDRKSIHSPDVSRIDDKLRQMEQTDQSLRQISPLNVDQYDNTEQIPDVADRSSDTINPSFHEAKEVLGFQLFRAYISDIKTSDLEEYTTLADSTISREKLGSPEYSTLSMLIKQTKIFAGKEIESRKNGQKIPEEKDIHQFRRALENLPKNSDDINVDLAEVEVSFSSDLINQAAERIRITRDIDKFESESKNLQYRDLDLYYDKMSNIQELRIKLDELDKGLLGMEKDYEEEIESFHFFSKLAETIER